HLRMIENHHLDLWNVRHCQNRITSPVAARDAALVERHLLVEGVAESHERAALDLPFELQRIDDDPWIHGDCVLVHGYLARFRDDGNVADAGPVRARAQHHRDTLPGDWR